jgi:hypothetical protein
MRFAPVAAVAAAAVTLAGTAGATTYAPPVPPVPPVPVPVIPPSPPSPAPAGSLPPIAWVAPSPADGVTLIGAPGLRTKFTVRAADRVAKALVHINPTATLPAGATIAVSNGNPAGATITFVPTAPGDYAIGLQARDNLPIPIASPVLTVNVHVQAGPEAMQLSGGPDNVSRWAYVKKPAVVRAAPSARAKVVQKLPRWTPENAPNLVLATDQIVDARNGTWVHVRLAKLPNNSMGWVLRSTLGPYHQVTTHLVVDRRALRATLFKNGVPIFSTIVGVGRPYWPTPRGEFYIREKLTSFKNPMYGPLAFGTSARSAVLTDWPGGGFIGIHGTNEPQIIPGRVSHGCIRLRNAQILKLARMLPLGTPVSIS